MASNVITDVVLVVKGAGVHKPDDTLNFFLKGFIPAIKSIFSKAKIRQTNDEKFFKDFPTSPHTTDQHNHLTEILIEGDELEKDRKTQDKPAKKNIKRRIWVKEIYWENELIPSNPWKAFFTEWQMASYALRRDITNNLRMIFPAGGFPLFWSSFALLYFVIGAFFFASFRERYAFSFFDNSTYWMALFPNVPELSSQVLKILFLGITSFLIALYPALMANRIWNKKSTHWKLSGLQKWVMVLLAVSFLLFTEEYIALLLIFVFPVLAMNLFRSILWNRRPHVNSDFRAEHIKMALW